MRISGELGCLGICVEDLTGCGIDDQHSIHHLSEKLPVALLGDLEMLLGNLPVDQARDLRAEGDQKLYELPAHAPLLGRPDAQRPDDAPIHHQRHRHKGRNLHIPQGRAGIAVPFLGVQHRDGLAAADDPAGKGLIHWRMQSAALPFGKQPTLPHGLQDVLVRIVAFNGNQRKPRVFAHRRRDARINGTEIPSLGYQGDHVIEGFELFLVPKALFAALFRYHYVL